MLDSSPAFTHYWMMFAIVTGCDGRLWRWAHSCSRKTRRQRWIFHSVERLLYSRKHVGAGCTLSRRPRRRLRKKISRSSSRRVNAERDLLLYSRMPLELRGAPYLASKEKLVRAGFGSYLKKCLTGTGGGCSVNTPATISLYLASICGKVRVVQVTLPLKITIWNNYLTFDFQLSVYTNLVHVREWGLSK